MEESTLDQGFSNYSKEEEGVVIPNSAIEILKNIGSWTQFLGILNYIVAGFFALGCIIILFIASTNTPIPGMGSFGLIALIYIPFVAVLYYLGKGLYNFGTKMKYAALYPDSESLKEGFDSLYSYFKIRGILTAIVVGIYVFVILIMLIGGGAALLGRF